MATSLIGNGALDVVGAAAFTALIVQQTKFLIEYMVKPTDKNHDAIVRIYVDIVALTVVIVSEIVTGILNVHNGQDWLNAVVQGFSVAIAAIAGYHLLNGLTPQTPNVPTLGQQLDQTISANPQISPLEHLAAAAVHLSGQPLAPVAVQPQPSLAVAPLETAQVRVNGADAGAAPGAVPPLSPGTIVVEHADSTRVTDPAVLEDQSTGASNVQPVAPQAIAITHAAGGFASANGGGKDAQDARSQFQHTLQEQWNMRHASMPGQTNP